MLNKDIYQVDPSTRTLINQGVASVNDQNQEVLRYELETFVCDGQYEKGLAHILETYLKNIEKPQQPAVWVSGFYGSGKSHLVKILSHLWVNTSFADGASARGLARLPQNIQDALLELSTQAKRHGGLHAASGTLGSGASGSVRLALLRILFKSVGLPEHYPVACFMMWLKQEDLEHKLKAEVEQRGGNWEEELDDFYFAETLHESLVALKPGLFSSTTACVDALNNLYPYVQDISSDEMLKAIRQALTIDNKFPLTLIVLDEVQQYIGEDSQRSIDVQEMVEACSKSLGGKVLFIGTGQTAIVGTPNLQRLSGRFTVRVELSDTDVDAVVRKVILAKRPEAKASIEQNLQNNLGEISRHLAGSTLGHNQNDIAYFASDYPILPVRRRFWEQTLRILDQTGTDSQLRNQLSMVHKAIQSNLEQSLGHVVPADYLFFDLAEKLLQTRILPRTVHEKILRWNDGSGDEKLMARAAGLVFLINKLSSNNKELGIQANLDTLSDLLVEDLNTGSGPLRAKLSQLVEETLPNTHGAKKYDLISKIGDEYRIQTEESQAWTDDYLSEKSRLANEAYRLEAERDDRIRKKFSKVVNKLSLQQGASKVSRDISHCFESQLPNDAQHKIYVWIRDGWSTDEQSVRADARQAGAQSPALFVYLPKRSADELRHHLIDFKAASATLEKRGTPNTPEGTEACAAMETIKQSAESRVNTLLDEMYSGARLFQGGGNEILGNNLQEMIQEGAKNALLRLYPQFDVADHLGWAKAYEKAKKGDPSALKAVGDEGEAAQNPVCKLVLGQIAGGKTGTDLRTHFEAAPYGWSRDTVDGALLILVNQGLVIAQDERGRTVEGQSIERREIGKTRFKVESATVSTAQRIQIRKLFQKIGLQVKNGEELNYAKDFLEQAQGLARSAGGEAPKPETPDISLFDDFRLVTGNELLLALYNRRDDFTNNLEQWQSAADKIAFRWPQWETLTQLMRHAEGLEEAEVLLAQAKALQQQRQLLAEPNPMEALISGLAQILRTELHRLDQAYEAAYEKGYQELQFDPNWQALDPEQNDALMRKYLLNASARPKVDLEHTNAILKTLNQYALRMFKDRVAALPSRFQQVATEAAKLCEPAMQFVNLSRETLRSAEDIDAWINKTKMQLLEALEQGPVVVKS